MTPQESQLIQSVAQRLRATNLTEKDSQAERQIQTEIGSQKDALYLLTQAVIVQEQGLKHAQERIQQLEGALQNAQQQAASATQHGGFLSGLFGGTSTPAPTAVAPAPAPPPPGSIPQAGSPSAAGSFLRTAAASAAGVIGGQLIFDGLRHMFGGGLGSLASAGSGGGFLGGGPSIVEENITNIYERNPSGADFGNANDANGPFGSGGDFGASTGNDPNDASVSDASDNNADASSGADFDDTNSYEEDDDDMDDDDTY